MGNAAILPRALGGLLFRRDLPGPYARRPVGGKVRDLLNRNDAPRFVDLGRDFQVVAQIVGHAAIVFDTEKRMRLLLMNTAAAPLSIHVLAHSGLVTVNKPDLARAAAHFSSENQPVQVTVFVSAANAPASSANDNASFILTSPVWTTLTTERLGELPYGFMPKTTRHLR